MKYPIAIALLAASPQAAAEVASAGSSGLEVRSSVEVPLLPHEAFAAFGRPAHWWSAGHTYSGKADNLSMTLSPGGCFCESFPGGGGIEHLRVTYVDPNKRIVLTGALGPLLYEAVAGVMDVKMEAIAGGSRVTMSYKAAGFAAGKAEQLAPLVDQVLVEQMKRYRDYASPEPDQR